MCLCESWCVEHSRKEFGESRICSRPGNGSEVSKTRGRELAQDEAPEVGGRITEFILMATGHRWAGGRGLPGLTV